MSEQQFNQVWEIYRKATGRNPRMSPIQLNEVLTVLITLGANTWSELPAEMRRSLFRKLKYDQKEKLRVEVAGRVESIGEHFKLDDRLALAIPSSLKTNLRVEKQRSGLSMSAQVRRKLEGQ